MHLIVGIGLAALLISWALVPLLMPALRRYALAMPNARSSHKVPTPQGGGIAVLLGIAGSLVAAMLAGAGLPPLPVALWLGVAVLALIGAADDIHPLPASIRLAVHAGAVVLMLAGSLGPGGLVAAGAVPAAFLWLIVALAGTWMVNLTNFMDGLDWLTVAAIAPLATLIAIIGAIIGPTAGLTLADAALAAALAGAMLGFAPWNRPVARLFLGDVGSLAIGLLVFYLLLKLAVAGHLVAALVLPAYSVTDASVTLFRRILRGEAFWQSHRSHFYQQATANGLSPLQVSVRILTLNLALAGLAAASILDDRLWIDALVLAGAAGLVVLTLRRFTQARPGLSPA
jgi:UDP-N-acetylmuramyl pentapeptide phosphotransferase/UDP-N-acetylglucosamine-1-phosphate transferase